LRGLPLRGSFFAFAEFGGETPGRQIPWRRAMVHDTTIGLTVLSISWVTVCGGIWTLAERADRVLTPEVRKATTDWLLSGKFEPFSGGWADAFAAAFDAVFGKRLFSFKGFIRSCAVSVVWFLLLYLVWAAVHVHYVRTELAAYVKSESWVVAIGAPFCVTIVLNFIPDYISLLKSRRIILWMQRSDHLLSSLGLMLLDIVITLLIGLLAYLSLTYVVSKNMPPIDATPTYELLSDTVKDFFHSVVLLKQHSISGVPFPKGLWFYTTFMTSSWVILHVCAGLLSRAVHSLGSLSRGMTRLFDVRKQPFLSLAVMAIALVTAAYIPIGLLSVVF
jgi:hypothetical protein